MLWPVKAADVLSIFLLAQHVLPVVQSICSFPVETAVSMEVGANSSTQLTEVIT